MSGAFQSKDGCLKVSSPCLCLCVSPILAILMPDVGLASASHSAITAAVAGWKAAYVTAAWVASDSAIPACILYSILCIWWSAYSCLLETYS